MANKEKESELIKELKKIIATPMVYRSVVHTRVGREQVSFNVVNVVEIQKLINKWEAGK